MVKIVLGILAFAVVTAVLYVWGLRRSATQASDLERNLLSKGAARVLKYLKTHETISEAETAELVKGLRASLPWSRQRVAVEDPKTFAGRLLEFMLEQLYLERLPDGRCRRRP